MSSQFKALPGRGVLADIDGLRYVLGSCAGEFGPPLNCCPMRRFLLILLMLLLPAQWTWAAAAAYCQHEPALAGRHLGHHAHPQHQHGSAGWVGGSTEGPADGSVDSTADRQTDAKALSGVAADCDHCHGHGSAALYAAKALLPPGAIDPCARSKAHAVPGPALPRPERPQWRCLA